jgi:U2 small nuclear ribonucleoprotein A'
MRLSAELLNSAEQRSNPLGERELILRGMGIPAVENLGVGRDAFDTIDFTDNRLTRLENFPRLLRLTSLFFAGNVVETIDVNNMKTNLPNITSLSLDNNRISTLHEVSNVGKAWPKLTFLSLLGNPVTSKYYLSRCGF